MQSILICIQTGKTIQDDDKLEFETDEFYLKSTDEMYDLFAIAPDACENTNRIAEQCNFDFEFGVTKLPYFEAPDGMENQAYFEKLCYEGLTRRYGSNPAPEIRERLDYEIDVIRRMGYTNYYLIVFDFINYAKTQGIPVGPRDAEVAPEVWLPIVWVSPTLIPSATTSCSKRFLNPERVSMPDFDVDFCYERRQEVIDYVNNKYGTTTWRRSSPLEPWPPALPAGRWPRDGTCPMLRWTRWPSCSHGAENDPAPGLEVSPGA